MPLYIRDDDVDALAVKVQAITGAPTKTEAVRLALQHEIARNRKATPLRERLAKAKAIAASIGVRDPAFNMKTFTDEMWGD
ncbi:MAG TPA: type II toxin-antitoxin system VapB family antitoxin [Roseiarcus sp.]